jgi:hypothetical protein
LAIQDEGVALSISARRGLKPTAKATTKCCWVVDHLLQQVH